MIYQLALFIGFSRTLNAIATVNEVLKENSIEKQGTTNDEDRHEKDLAIQNPIYGDEIKKKFKDLPAFMNLYMIF